MPIDYKEYCPEWPEISRYVRFERAKNRCENCGAENHKPHFVTGSKVVLTVAHLNHDKNDNRHENLKALCQRCHFGHDRHLHAHSRKYGRQTRYLNGDLFAGTEWAINK